MTPDRTPSHRCSAVELSPRGIPLGLRARPTVWTPLGPLRYPGEITIAER
jgi:hypothetical protein